MSNKPFVGKNWGKSNIDLRDKGTVLEFLPTEIHLKENGTVNNGPSIAILLTGGIVTVMGQLSIEMWNDGLADIGYKLVKI